MKYRTRRILSLLILVVGLPLWIVAAVTVMNRLDAAFGRQPLWVEVAVYVALGMVWALPFRTVFRGIGQGDPDAVPPQRRPE
jgi:hypothetical protein